MWVHIRRIRMEVNMKKNGVRIEHFKGNVYVEKL